jgi:glucose/mannose transport system substrate-binding protein
MKKAVVAALAATLLGGTASYAADVEVTHWWTSGGEAYAVAAFADALNATGNHHWVDGAIGGSGDTARPIIISRIMGGDPPEATQFNPGKDADDLIDAGLMLDLTELAEKENWKAIVFPPSQLESCTRNGKVWCVPVNLHSGLWMWTNRHVFEDNGLTPPKNWDELMAAAPTLREKGIIPLSAAQGWPLGTLAENVEIGALGIENFKRIYVNRDIEFAKGPESRKVWEILDQARQVIDPNEIVAQWNDAVSLVITGAAAANVMGDWAQGEFAVAEQTAGVDYDCLPGLGINDVVNTGGDVFYFPKNDDPDLTAAQLELASIMISKEVQVSFNLRKGSMPIRQDIDLNAANDCMKKGLAILGDINKHVPSGAQMMQRETINLIRDLRNEFITNKDMSIDDAFAQYISILESAPA